MRLGEIDFVRICSKNISAGAQIDIYATVNTLFNFTEILIFQVGGRGCPPMDRVPVMLLLQLF